MPPWSIAAAQYAVCSGGLEANVEHHLNFVEHAVHEGVNLLIFPAFSLCYPTSVDDETATFTLHHPVFDPLSDAARATGLTIVTGLSPVSGNARSSRAAIFTPDGLRQSCCKPALEKYDGFAPCPATSLHGKLGQRFALGLSTDSDDEALAHSAAALGADLYITGSHTPLARWQHDAMYLQQWAHKYHIAILTVNQTCHTGRWHGTGYSAFWDAHGQLIMRAEAGELLLTGRRSAAGWQGEVIPVR